MRKRTTATALGAVAVLVLAGAGCSEGNVFSLEEGSCFQDPDTLEVSDPDIAAGDG